MSAANVKRGASGPHFDLEAAFKFLRGLRRNNDRAWFHAHKDAWDRLRPAWEELVAYLVFTGAAFDDRLRRTDPRRCLFRLANDTRFHTGKAPYKSHLSAWMSPGGKDGAFAGYYVHLAPGAAHVSAGIYVPTRPALSALRRTFDEDGVAARAFDRILRAKALAPYLPLDTHPLRVTPPGFSRDHPRIALIKARRLLVSRDPSDEELRRRGVTTVFLDFMRATAPLVRWIDERATRAVNDDDEGWD